jgi:hypothetical protein
MIRAASGARHRSRSRSHDGIAQDACGSTGVASGLAHDGSRFDSSFRQLGDLSDVNLDSLDPAVVREVAASRVFAPGARRALVAPADHVYGLSRIFAAYADTGLQEVKVFRDMPTAERWLNLPQPVADGVPG